MTKSRDVYKRQAQEMSVSADTDAAVDEALSVCHEGSLIDRFVET